MSGNLSRTTTRAVYRYEKTIRKRSPRAIVFDVDGTLFDVRDRYVQAFQKALEAGGYPISPTQSGRILAMRRKGRSGKQIIAALTGIPDSRKIEQLDRQRKAFVDTPSLLQTDRLFPHVRETLASLRQKGYRLAVLSMRKNLSADLERFGIRGCFDAIVAIDKAVSPDKTADLQTLSRTLGVSTFELVVVGDTEMDIYAGHRVGAKTVGVLTGLSSRALLQSYGADYIAKGLDEVARLF